MTYSLFNCLLIYSIDILYVMYLDFKDSFPVFFAVISSSGEQLSRSSLKPWSHTFFVILFRVFENNKPAASQIDFISEDNSSFSNDAPRKYRSCDDNGGGLWHNSCSV